MTQVGSVDENNSKSKIRWKQTKQKQLNYHFMGPRFQLRVYEDTKVVCVPEKKTCF